MTVVTGVNIYHCKFPLKIDYKLAYGTISTYDTIILEMTDQTGSVSYGEATFLPGYSDEMAYNCFNVSLEIGNKVLNLETNEALAHIRMYKERYPFLSTAFACCIEGFSRKYSNKEISVPIIGLINVESEESIKETVEELIENNYKVVKTKIGHDSRKSDIKKLGLIEKYADGNLKIRVDANQSMENQNVDNIVKELTGFNLQLLEQPFKKDNLEKHLELSERAPFPIMLDESIWDYDDIDLIVDTSLSKYIKLKLQKCGSLSQFEKMINYARDKGIEVVIGNGVQTDLNCILEAGVYDRCKLTESAENIGFSKLTTPITKNNISIKGGHILIVDEAIEVDNRTIERYATSLKKLN
jgi:L-alanine-DL-glutamate epimerase-like enolase superfamily enzyme